MKSEFYVSLFYLLVYNMKNITILFQKNPKCEEYGLTFMCLCPGFVDTEMVRTGGPHCLNPNIFELAKSSGLLK